MCVRVDLESLYGSYNANEGDLKACHCAAWHVLLKFHSAWMDSVGDLELKFFIAKVNKLGGNV